MEFRSKIDNFFIAVISITTLVILAVFIIPLSLDHERTLTDTIVVLSIFVLVIWLFLWSAFSIKYVFYQDHLFIKGGPFRSRIAYKEITRVSTLKGVFTGFSGYRLLSSKEGIEIFYKSATLGSVKISPNDIELFISEMKKRCPSLQLDQ